MKLIRYIYGVYALLLFVVLMFIAFPFIMLSLLFGKVKGGNLVYKICRLWGIIWYLAIGIRHKIIIEEAANPNKQYIFVANHVSYMDIPATVMAVNQPYRVLGKREMVNYPIFGLIYRMAVITVNRENVAERSKSVRALKAALNKGISIFIFPEGTFNETTNLLKPFFDGAFRLAIQTQTPIKPILFVDTNKRMHQSSIFSLNPGPCRVVYLPPIEVEGHTLKDVHDLKQKVYITMEDGLKRYGATSPW